MKHIKTIIIILIVIGLGLLAYNLASTKKTSSLSTEALSDFAVRDTAAIDQLIISDTEGSAGVELKKVDGIWQMNSGECVQQHLVHTMLETIKYVKVKGPVGEGAILNINKSIAAHNTKMDIYQNGKLVKTWYIGDPTQDQYGTFMLLKDPEKGKSPEPFIMHLPNMYGNLSSRFITDPLLLECTDVFVYDPLDIATLDVTIPDSSHLNFKIVANKENSFSVYNNETRIENLDTTKARAYLVNFRKIHFENHNYTLSEENLDSLKNSTPYYTINLTTKSGETNNVRIFKRRYYAEKYDLDGNLLDYDQDRVWVELNNGQIVVGQYYVFGKLLMDINYFISPSL